MRKCQLDILHFWLHYIGCCGLGDGFGTESAKLGGGPDDLVGIREIVREISSEAGFSACLNEG